MSIMVIENSELSLLRCIAAESLDYAIHQSGYVEATGDPYLIDLVNKEVTNRKELVSYLSEMLERVCDQGLLPDEEVISVQHNLH